MPAAVQTLLDTQHEAVAAFDAVELPLNKRLEGMLNENIEHQSPRRGCGFTQASRFLAGFINQPRSLTFEHDLRLFSPSVHYRFREMIPKATARLQRAPQGITELREALEQDKDGRRQNSFIEQLQALEMLSKTLRHEESRLIVELILAILGKRSQSLATSLAPNLEPYSCKLAIGTCPEAERYFLEYGGGYLRRQGIMNLFYAERQQPIIIEKVNIGDSHSCITLAPIKLNNVYLPAGSLLGTCYTQVPVDVVPCKTLQGAWLPITLSHGFRFLRLSTLAISPQNRARAFGQHLKRQLEGNPFFDPLNTNIQDLMNTALEQRTTP